MRKIILMLFFFILLLFSSCGSIYYNSPQKIVKIEQKKAGKKIIKQNKQNKKYIKKMFYHINEVQYYKNPYKKYNKNIFNYWFIKLNIN